MVDRERQRGQEEQRQKLRWRQRQTVSLSLLYKGRSQYCGQLFRQTDEGPEDCHGSRNSVVAFHKIPLNS